MRCGASSAITALWHSGPRYPHAGRAVGGQSAEQPRWTHVTTRDAQKRSSFPGARLMSSICLHA